MTSTKLKKSTLRAAKRGFTTRRVPESAMHTVVSGDIAPRPGDLVLATVHELGQHERVERPDGRRARVVPGDRVLVAYGNRYAPDQYEAVVSDDLGHCALVAAGGVAARETFRHERMDEPTQLLPEGLVGDAEGRPINLADHAVAPAPPSTIPVLLVAGTAMNAGKTLTAASLVRGLALAGHRVAGIKGTGTGAGGDLWMMADLGAHRVYDFTDAGFASTYLAPDGEIETALFTLIDRAAADDCDVAVMEIADGLQHRETHALFSSERMRARVEGVVFAAYDALGARAGNGILTGLSHRLIAVSGQLARSPLAVREAGQATDAPIHTPLELQSGVLNGAVLGAAAADALAEMAPGTTVETADADLADLLPDGETARRVLRHPKEVVTDALDALSGESEATTPEPRGG